MECSNELTDLTQSRGLHEAQATVLRTPPVT